MEFNATFLVSAISFLVFVFLMNKIFYAPLEKIIGEREKLVDDTLNEANNSKTQAAQLLQEREDKLNKVTNDTRKIINDGVQKANSNANTLITAAKSDSVKKISEQKTELEKEATKIEEELKEHVREIASQISTKILG